MEENVSVNCWNEDASGGWASEVMPSFFIITFCAWTVGFVARRCDFFASLSLRRMVNSCGCCRERRLGGEATSTGGGGASPHIACAKLATVSLTGVLASGKRLNGSDSRVPRVTVMLRSEGEECRTGASPCKAKHTDSRAGEMAYPSNAGTAGSASIWDTRGGEGGISSTKDGFDGIKIASVSINIGST